MSSAARAAAVMEASAACSRLRGARRTSRCLIAALVVAATALCLLVSPAEANLEVDRLPDDILAENAERFGTGLASNGRFIAIADDGGTGPGIPSSVYIWDATVDALGTLDFDNAQKLGEENSGERLGCPFTTRSAMGIDDTTMVVCALDTGNSLEGMIKVATYDGSSWSWQGDIPDPDTNIEATHRFAHALALVGTTALAGTQDLKTSGERGQAYIYPDVTAVTPTPTTLTPAGITSSDNKFGDAVALSSDLTYAVISDPKNNDVYVFERTGDLTMWSQLQVIGPVGDESGCDNFGESVAVDGDYLAIGCVDLRTHNNGAGDPDHVALYKLDSGTGLYVHEINILPPDANYGTFGHAIDLLANSGSIPLLVVSETLYTTGGNSNVGRVFVYRRDGEWALVLDDKTIPDPVLENGVFFGRCVSLFDETVVIGSGGGPAGETEAKLFGPSCGTFWGDQTTACDGSDTDKCLDDGNQECVCPPGTVDPPICPGTPANGGGYFQCVDSPSADNDLDLCDSEDANEDCDLDTPNGFHEAGYGDACGAGSCGTIVCNAGTAMLECNDVGTTTFYRDTDGDGFGDPGAATTDACAAPAGHVEDNSDCDDTDEDINPDATEVCDGVDNNCVAGIDEGHATSTTLYLDDDEDGFGDNTMPLSTCQSSVPGYVDDNTDCDDNNDAIGGPEDWFNDGDGDNFGDAFAENACVNAPPGCFSNSPPCVNNDLDCDDGDNLIKPGVTDGDPACDSVDDDCDGNTDEDHSDTVSFFHDFDSDTFGDPDDELILCNGAPQPADYETNNGDCDDDDVNTNPGILSDTCTPAVDNDCDGTVGEDETGAAFMWYPDDDGDDYGEEGSSPTLSCTPIAGMINNDGDCNDADGGVNPGVGVDDCNNVDNDCDGTTDEDGFVTFFADDDGDGFGDAADTSDACAAPPGYVANSNDCDDTRDFVYPGAPELCDSLDNDCDSDPSDDGADHDGLGDNCDSTADADLCDDGELECTVASAAMGGLECIDDPGVLADLCNGEDDDCNPDTPDGFDESNYYDACDSAADEDAIEDGRIVCLSNGGTPETFSMQCNDGPGDPIDYCDGNTNDDGDVTTPDGYNDPRLPSDGPPATLGDTCGAGRTYTACIDGDLICTDTGAADGAAVGGFASTGRLTSISNSIVPPPLRRRRRRDAVDGTEVEMPVGENESFSEFVERVRSQHVSIRSLDVLYSYLVTITCATCVAGDDFLYPPGLSVHAQTGLPYMYEISPATREYDWLNLPPNTEFVVTLYTVTQSAFDDSFAFDGPFTSTIDTLSNNVYDDVIDFPSNVVAVADQDTVVITWDEPLPPVLAPGIPVIVDHYEVGFIAIDGPLGDPLEQAEWVYIKTTGDDRNTHFDNMLDSEQRYAIMVRAFFVDPEDNEYASDDSSSFDKASSVGYAEVVTTAYEQCSANGDYTAGVHGLDVGGGRCACFSGWASLGTGEHDSMALTQACNDRVSDKCFDPDRYDIAIETVRSLPLSSGVLDLSIEASIVINGFIRRVTFGTTGACDYPGAYWTKSLDESTCSETLRSTIPLSDLVDICGLDDPYESPTPCPDDPYIDCDDVESMKARDLGVRDLEEINLWLIYQSELEIVIAEPVPGFDDGRQSVRTQRVTVVVAVPAQLVVSFTNLVVAESHTFDYGLVGSSFSPGLTTTAPGEGTVSFRTSITWPYSVDTLTLTAFPDGIASAVLTIDLPHTILCGTDTDLNAGEPCIQQWRLTIEPEVICSFSGDFVVEAEFGCRDSTLDGGSCVLPGKSLTIDDITGTLLCSTAYTSTGDAISARMAVYNPDCVTPQTSFQMGTSACLAATVSSSAFLTIASVDLDYAVAYEAGTETVYPVTTEDLTDSSETVEVFSVAFNAAAFPNTAQGETDVYVILATLDISYEDGLRTRRVLTASASVTPEATFTLTGPSGGGGGGGGGDGGGGTGALGTGDGAGGEAGALSTAGLVTLVSMVVLAVAIVVVTVLLVKSGKFRLLPQRRKRRSGKAKGDKASGGRKSRRRRSSKSAKAKAKAKAKRKAKAKAKSKAKGKAGRRRKRRSGAADDDRTDERSVSSASARSSDMATTSAAEESSATPDTPGQSRQVRQSHQTRRHRERSRSEDRSVELSSAAAPSSASLATSEEAFNSRYDVYDFAGALDGDYDTTATFDDGSYEFEATGDPYRYRSFSNDDSGSTAATSTSAATSSAATSAAASAATSAMTSAAYSSEALVGAGGGDDAETLDEFGAVDDDDGDDVNHGDGTGYPGSAYRGSGYNGSAYGQHYDEYGDPVEREAVPIGAPRRALRTQRRSDARRANQAAETSGAAATGEIATRRSVWGDTKVINGSAA